MKVKLREVAHARTGEKGDIANLSVIAYREDDYALIEKQVTVASVRELYGPITKDGGVRIGLRRRQCTGGPIHGGHSELRIDHYYGVAHAVHDRFQEPAGILYLLRALGHLLFQRFPAVFELLQVSLLLRAFALHRPVRSAVYADQPDIEQAEQAEIADRGPAPGVL